MPDNKQTILVIAAHPDDEVLGCGGTIAKHIDQGDTVHVAILAEGITSRRGDDPGREGSAKELSVLHAAAQRAGEILGITSLSFHNFPDNRMDSIDRLDVTKVVEQLVADKRPDTVYTHYAQDVNIDHRRTHEAVITACRPTPEHCVRGLLFFEIPSSTEWIPSGTASGFYPNWFVNIENTLARKLNALQVYSSEVRAWPHSRSLQSLEHLARWRGACVGIEAAEAFVLGRRILG